MRLRLGLSCVVVAVALACGPASAAAASGALYGFGDNSLGELGLGHGTAATISRPKALTLPGATGAVTGVAAGGFSTLVITSSGQLYAFGNNRFGELGMKGHSGTDSPSDTPLRVRRPPGSGAPRGVAAGYDHSLVVTTTGRLYAFGDNTSGQLGTTKNLTAPIDTPGKPHPTPTPVKLPAGAGPVVNAAAGDDFSLALTASGRLYAFGGNSAGDLGIGTDARTPAPTEVALPGATAPIVRIAAGGTHAVALTASGQVYTFGENDSGQLGVPANSGTEQPNSTPTQVALPAGSGKVIDVAAGDRDTLLLTATGAVYAFGANRFGQLGTRTNAGTELPNPTPTAVSLPAGSGKASEISAAANASFVATSTGRLYAFGLNADGQLGSGQNLNSTRPNPVPMRVPLPVGRGAKILAVSRGDGDHTLVIVATPAPLPTALSVATRTRCASTSCHGELTIRYKLSGNASVRLTLTRLLPGFVDNNRCHKPVASLTGEPCARLDPLGSLVRPGHRGANVVTVSASPADAPLGPGHYLVIVTAMQHGYTSAPQTIPFTIKQ